MAQQDIPASAVSRRLLLTGAAAVGVATATVGVVSVAAAQPDADSQPEGTTEGTTESDGPIVVHVRDLHSGTLDVFTGSKVYEVRDKDLAKRLARAARA